MDKRLIEIECWLKNVLNEDIRSLAPASSDASFRRYFRITVENGSYIVMDAPPDKESTDAFVHAGAALNKLGLHAPEIYSRSSQQGFLLLEDLGTTLYLDQLNENTADDLYRDAIAAIVRLQEGPETLPGITFPLYDAQLLNEEMSLFETWYVNRHLGTQLDHGQSVALQESVHLLTQSALTQPRTWVHRDYHSRNLMKVPGANPGIIDFQDMVNGPITYDLVSLLKDCYIRWPRSRVEQWVEMYLDMSAGRTHDPQIESEYFLEMFDLMGAQRHLKVLGIFARLNYRDGKPQYLDDLPLVLEYLLETCAQYRSLSPLNELLLGLHADVGTT